MPAGISFFIPGRHHKFRIQGNYCFNRNSGANDTSGRSGAPTRNLKSSISNLFLNYKYLKKLLSLITANQINPFPDASVPFLIVNSDHHVLPWQIPVDQMGNQNSKRFPPVIVIFMKTFMGKLAINPDFCRFINPSEIEEDFFVSPFFRNNQIGHVIPDAIIIRKLLMQFRTDFLGNLPFP